MGKGPKLIFTCEHGGNKIPPPWRRHFPSSSRAMLQSHRGWDLGALKVARGLSTVLGAPLFFSETSRLLVDLNRSAHHPKIFSDFLSSLRTDEKVALLGKYYAPYRKSVESKITSMNRNGHQVLHFSIHSFTPVLNGDVRTCEIGILYDPSRPLERETAIKLRRSLRDVFPDLRIKMNYPYKGTSDGFTSALRKITKPALYSGIEIEFNQAILKKIKTPAAWRTFIRNTAWAIELASH